MSEKQIPLFKVYIPPEQALMPNLRDVLYSGQISEGAPVTEFEQRFGDLIGSSNTLSFSSGTAALHTALLLAGVGTGDEVISTPMTAEPTNMAICHTGARIIWADVNPRNGNLDAASIESRISSRTKAVMLVHYGGIPASLNAIRSIAEKHGVPVIEDAAHALGARYAGRALGSHSEYVMFSFQAIKHLTTIDGGMLACKDPRDLPRGRTLRWFGIDRMAPRTDVDIQAVGYKYNMNNVNATLGLVQLEHIVPVIQRHIENGKFFDERLRDIPGIELCSWDKEAEPSYWFYTVLVERRDDFSRYLTEKGIGNSQAHRRNDWHSVFTDSHCELPSLDLFYSRMLHIPCGWWITDEDREYIVNMIGRGW